MTFRTVVLLFCVAAAAGSTATKSSAAAGPDKLVAWVKENSEVFMILKHWNELPLISTAWKRLRDTPKIVEDRNAFIAYFESLLEPLTTTQDRLRKKSLNLTDCIDCQNSTTTPNPGSSVTNPDLVTSTEPTVIITTEIPSENSNSSHSTTVETVSTTEEVTSNFGCNVDKQNPEWLIDYEQEKKWMRSQLIPLNYLFDRLKSIETDAKELRVALNGRNPSSSLTDSTAFIPDNVLLKKTGVVDVESRLQSLDSISQTLQEDYNRLKIQVFEIINTTKQELNELQGKIDRLSSLRPTGFNGTADEGEYCPERLDEMVPCSEIGDSCYCFSKQQKNWTESLQYCQKNNMYLLSLETEKETEMISNYIKTSGLPKDFYWTSGSDETEEGQWAWMSQEQQNLTFTNWRTNQPDGGRKENCLYLHSRDDFKWGDWMCNLAQHFICEW